MKTTTMPTVFNRSVIPLANPLLGFDRVFDLLEESFNNRNTSSSYPPCNIIKVDEYNYLIELAVAGFEKDEISIESKDERLYVKGVKTLTDDRNYIVKGIGARNFEKEFILYETIEVLDANLVQGILTIKLQNHIPEHKKPKQISIL